jgi:hypothetical protein
VYVAVAMYERAKMSVLYLIEFAFETGLPNSCRQLWFLKIPMVSQSQGWTSKLREVSDPTGPRRFSFEIWRVPERRQYSCFSTWASDSFPCLAAMVVRALHIRDTLYTRKKHVLNFFKRVS